MLLKIPQLLKEFRFPILFLIFCLLMVPLLSNSWIRIFSSTAIFSLAAAGVCLMYARLGLVNLAQIALVGLGGWMTLRFNYATNLPFEINLLLAAVITAFVGAILALPALRMRGLYLALVTLMAAGAFQIIFNGFQFPNGGDGFWGVAYKSAEEIRRPVIAHSDQAFLVYVIGVAFIGFIIAGCHVRGKPGRAWAMIRQSEASAMAAGVNVTLYKVWAFALSGFLAGLAGGLLAAQLKILSAATFQSSESILIFALAIIGGSWHWLGAIIAGLLYRALPALLNDLGLDADLAMIFFGVALLHAIMNAPQGISGQILALFKKGKSVD